MKRNIDSISYHKYSWSAIGLALGISLSTATQFRRQDIPIGPGEIILILWLISQFFALVWRKFVIRVAEEGKKFTDFWLFSFPLLFIGFYLASAMQLAYHRWYRDFFALLLVASLCFFISIRKDFHSLVIQTAKISISCLIIPICLLYIAYLQGIYLDFIRLGQFRFLAWANNPNQIGMIMSITTYIGIHFAIQSPNKLQSAYYILLSIASLILGFASRSDSYTSAILCGLGIIILWYIFHINLQYTNLLYLTGIFWGSCLGILLLNYLNLNLIEMSIEYAMGVYGDMDQGIVRLMLWQNSIDAMSVVPPFGLGFGAFSGVQEAFLGSEAHNTFLDWGASAGLLGLILYIRLFFILIKGTWNSKQPILLATLFSMIGFSMFTYVIRHPIYWFYLIVIAEISSSALPKSVNPSIYSQLKIG